MRPGCVFVCVRVSGCHLSFGFGRCFMNWSSLFRSKRLNFARLACGCSIRCVDHFCLSQGPHRRKKEEKTKLKMRTGEFTCACSTFYFTCCRAPPSNHVSWVSRMLLVLRRYFREVLRFLEPLGTPLYCEHFYDALLTCEGIKEGGITKSIHSTMDGVSVVILCAFITEECIGCMCLQGDQSHLHSS